MEHHSSSGSLALHVNVDMGSGRRRGAGSAGEWAGQGSGERRGAGSTGVRAAQGRGQHRGVAFAQSSAERGEVAARVWGCERSVETEVLKTPSWTSAAQLCCGPRNPEVPVLAGGGSVAICTVFSQLLWSS